MVGSHKARSSTAERVRSRTKFGGYRAEYSPPTEKDPDSGKKTVQYGEAILKLLSTLLPTIAFCFALYQYVDQNERDFRKSVYEKQASYYEAMSEAVADIIVRLDGPESFAELINSKEYKLSRYKFMTLYYGKLNLIESPEVERSVIRFRDLLERYEANDADIRLSDIKLAGLSVSEVCSKSLQKTWGLDPEQFETKIIKQ
ncbi:hypothetical protein JAO73_10645 [Hymenobacter sp. BT523]|uniref:hypothetical protein n=1 Tax=Hymenobacter sp. BT523 TaxID=2795725 RepID=UPI0018ED697C|nr:hypothetical protein [Hymenobacter sp. BT523]MBJ6109474.1 hypothetical protein [Hymenobacter sp. BT523]